MVKQIILVFFILIFSSCSTENVNTPPRRFIDQNFTLPKKTDVWGTVLFLYDSKFKKDKDVIEVYLPLPIYWEFSLGENITLETPIIPNAFRFSLLKDEKYEIGIRAGILSLFDLEQA